MNVVLSTRELPKRGPSGRAMLRTISDADVAWQRRASPTEFVVAFHGGAPTGDYRDWRFRTVAPWLRASYFERWVADSAQADAWYLNRAYLHLYRVGAPREETEFLALHCDPNEPPDAAHAKYKRGPHLHIKVAENPFPKAHIALNLSDLASVLSSVESLTDALGLAVLLIRERVIDLYLREAT